MIQSKDVVYALVGEISKAHFSSDLRGIGVFSLLEKESPGLRTHIEPEESVSLFEQSLFTYLSSFYVSVENELFKAGIERDSRLTRDNYQLFQKTLITCAEKTRQAALKIDNPDMALIALIFKTAQEMIAQLDLPEPD